MMPDDELQAAMRRLHSAAERAIDLCDEGTAKCNLEIERCERELGFYVRRDARFARETRIESLWFGAFLAFCAMLSAVFWWLV